MVADRRTNERTSTRQITEHDGRCARGRASCPLRQSHAEAVRQRVPSTPTSHVKPRRAQPGPTGRCSAADERSRSRSRSLPKRSVSTARRGLVAAAGGRGRSHDCRAPLGAKAFEKDRGGLCDAYSLRWAMRCDHAHRRSGPRAARHRTGVVLSALRRPTLRRWPTGRCMARMLARSQLGTDVVDHALDKRN